MAKNNKAEYSAHTQKLIDIAESGFKFHSLPESEEQFWYDKKEAARPVQAVKDLGRLAISAAGVGISALSVGGSQAMEVISRGKEKLWRGLSIGAERAGDEGLEEYFWNKTADVGERMQEGTSRIASYLGAAAIGATIRKEVAEATGAKFSPIPAYWGILSKSAELLSNGTDSAANQLEKLSIDEDKKGRLFKSVQRTSAAKADNHRERVDHRSQSVSSKKDDLSARSEAIKTRERSMTKKEKSEARKLAEGYRKKAEVAHSYGNYSDASKYMHQARLQQDLLLRGRVAGRKSSATPSRSPHSYPAPPSHPPLSTI